MNLYELTVEAQNLADILAHEELSEDQAADALKLQEIILEGLIPEKVESYCHVIANWTARPRRCARKRSAWQNGARSARTTQSA